MANNPYVNKVVYGNSTVMDISDTTLTPTDAPDGEVFYQASGQRSVGSAKYASSATVGGSAKMTEAIPYGVVDSTSTSTAYTATVAGITEYKDGTCVMLKNGVVTSAANFTININGLGAKRVMTNLGAAAYETTKFNVNYTLMFTYDTTRVEGGVWLCYNGYDSNTNTIGYQLRTNSTVRKVTDRTRYYRILFSSADDTKWVPANTGYDNSATSTKTVNTRKIDPFGDIVYLGSTTNYAANADMSATTIWQQYVLNLGYSFNRTGAALELTVQSPVFVKCAPQSDGSAIIDSTTPIVQALPSSKDNKIYIYLGVAYSATNIELVMNHPVYYHDGTGIRIWTGSTGGSDISVTQIQSTGTKIATITVDNVGTDLYAPSGSTVEPATATPSMDGTAAVGSSAKYAREDHVHPKDTSKLDKSNGDIALTVAAAQFRATFDDGDTTNELAVKASKAEFYSYDYQTNKESSVSANYNGAVILYANDGTNSNTLTVTGTQTQIHKVPTPTNNGDAANKQYVDDGLSGKQATLVSGTNIKTVNSTSLLGSGDVAVQPTLVSGTNIKTVNSTSLLGSGDIAVQPTLVSGTNIKTVNSTSLLGSGNVAVQPTLVSGTNIKTVNNTSLLGSGDVAVQPTLVSGTNIKTINNESLLGSGNITIQGGTSPNTASVTLTTAGWSNNAQTASVTGMTANASVIIAAAPTSMNDYATAGVYCSAQASNSLTFTCAETPSSALTVNVMWF